MESVKPYHLLFPTVAWENFVNICPTVQLNLRVAARGLRAYAYFNPSLTSQLDWPSRHYLLGEQSTVRQLFNRHEQYGPSQLSSICASTLSIGWTLWLTLSQYWTLEPVTPDHWVSRKIRWHILPILFRQQSSDTERLRTSFVFDSRVSESHNGWYFATSV